MFILSVIILAIVAFLLETVVIDFIIHLHIKPDFITIITVYSGLFLNKNAAGGIGFTLGLIQDALSFRLMGINSLSKCLIGFSTGGLREKILGENLTVQCLLTIAATFLNGIIFFLISNGLLSSEIDIFGFFKSLMIQALYNSILAPIIFLLLNKIRTQNLKLKTPSLFRF